MASFLVSPLEGPGKAKVFYRGVRRIVGNVYRRSLVSLSAMRKSNNQKADNFASLWLLLGVSHTPNVYKVRRSVVTYGDAAANPPLAVFYSSGKRIVPLQKARGKFGKLPG